MAALGSEQVTEGDSIVDHALAHANDVSNQLAVRIAHLTDRLRPVLQDLQVAPGPPQEQDVPTQPGRLRVAANINALADGMHAQAVGVDSLIDRLEV